MNKTRVYYQPNFYHDDGTHVEYGGIPDELMSFQAFATKDDCEDWLEANGYDPADFSVIEYANDDIEDVTIIDGNGDIIEVNGEDYSEDDIDIWYGSYDEDELSYNGLAIVTWPESQELMEIPNYKKHSYLINDEEGLDLYGSSAYVVEKAWLEETSK